jgi:hypothetical protein
MFKTVDVMGQKFNVFVDDVLKLDVLGARHVKDAYSSLKTVESWKVNLTLL